MAGCGCASSAEEAIDPRFRRILWAALLANAAMFVVEVAASVFSGSVSLQADALDFLGDAVSYAITLFVLGLSLRARARAAMVKSATMASFGTWVIGSAVYRAVTQTVPDASIMGATAMLALLVNVGVAVGHHSARLLDIDDALDVERRAQHH